LRYVFSLLLVSKLYLVQIVSGSAFVARASDQYTRPVDGIFNRGTIFFQSKDGTLMAAASLKTGYTVAINPKLIKNPESVYQKISEIISIKHDEFIAKATKINDTYEEIAKRVEPEYAKKIEALKISGLNIYKEEWRSYPAGDLASQVIGFVGSDGNDLSGRYGLEKKYDTVLRRNAEEVYVNFFAEIFSGINKTLTDNGNAEGDLISTIEPNVETYLEKQLQIVEDSYKSQVTGGVIIDPKTGEIYAMAANPSYDPNNFQNVKDLNVFTNPSVQSVYEMGSIFKALTMAAGLDAGVVTPTSTYNDTGCIDLNSSTICNFDLKARGPGTSMQKVLNESLNLGAAYVEKKLGNKLFADYMYKFGIADPTNIDLPNEVKGLVKTLKSPRDVEYATAAFGQGIAVTPIETVRALSAMANGGNLITPHVIKKIDYNVGFSRDITYPQGLQVLKPETSHTISMMLTNVVDTALLEGKVKMDHYSIAAKTGTAQIVNPATNKYYDKQYLHSFFGYFPAQNPRFLVFLYTVKPQGVEYASHTLTQPFVNITKYLINYYEVPPDR
jgi:stage V sporulation protein D (sporulation-specific penicillin-binding protein)